MRVLTSKSIPFSFEYISLNTTDETSKGLKRVNKALLRTGMSQEKSKKSGILIGYTEEPAGLNKWFYYPLLQMFNNKKVVP